MSLCKSIIDICITPQHIPLGPPLDRCAACHVWVMQPVYLPEGLCNKLDPLSDNQKTALWAWPKFRRRRD